MHPDERVYRASLDLQVPQALLVLMEAQGPVALLDSLDLLVLQVSLVALVQMVSLVGEEDQEMKERLVSQAGLVAQDLKAK